MMTTTILPHPATCEACGFSTRDLSLLGSHSCDVQRQGGRCEDFPCCGHELGDCNGLRYGSEEAIRARVEQEWDSGHGMCSHEEGFCAAY